mgnify:CR=1 FL=1
MKLLSIDVGIKNLAYCVVENENIIMWGVVNLIEEDKVLCEDVVKNVQCNHDAKFSKDGHHFCTKHAKKQGFLIPTKDLKKSTINKLSITDLRTFADKYDIAYDKNMKKRNILDEVVNFVNEKCFEEVVQISASDVSLVVVGKNLKQKFDEIFTEQCEINHVIIENQISPIATRMKTVQGMIAQYFIMKTPSCNIDFVSSANKLKIEESGVGDGERTTYNQRKKIGIESCESMIKKSNNLEWYQYFMNHKKKDDLADAYLQATWFMRRKTERSASFDM